MFFKFKVLPIVSFRFSSKRKEPFGLASRNMLPKKEPSEEEATAGKVELIQDTSYRKEDKKKGSISFLDYNVKFQNIRFFRRIKIGLYCGRPIGALIVKCGKERKCKT